jgi:hypothetical protein
VTWGGSVTWGHISKVDNSRGTRPTNPRKRGFMHPPPRAATDRCSDRGVVHPACPLGQFPQNHPSQALLPHLPAGGRGRTPSARRLRALVQSQPQHPHQIQMHIATHLLESDVVLHQAGPKTPVATDVPAFLPAGGDVITSSRPLNAQRSGPGRSKSGACLDGNCQLSR